MDVLGEMCRKAKAVLFISMLVGAEVRRVQHDLRFNAALDLQTFFTSSSANVMNASSLVRYLDIADMSLHENCNLLTKPTRAMMSNLSFQHDVQSFAWHMEAIMADPTLLKCMKSCAEQMPSISGSLNLQDHKAKGCYRSSRSDRLLDTLVDKLVHVCFNGATKSLALRHPKQDSTILGKLGFRPDVDPAPVDHHSLADLEEGSNTDSVLPPLATKARSENMESGLHAVAKSAVTLKNLIFILFSFLVYVGLSILVFTQLEHWSWIDCVYFSIITLTSVGYGDLSPKHPLSRLFLCLLVVMAFGVVAKSVGDFLDGVVAKEIKNERARKALRLKRFQDVGVFDEHGKRYHWRWETFRCLLGIATLIVISATVVRFLLKECDSWNDAFYFTFITLSTIGYGDVVPIRGTSKLVVGLLCFVGVPVFALLLARIVDIAYGKARSEHMHTIVGGLTPHKFQALTEFRRSMWENGCFNTNPSERQVLGITPFEFLCFIFTKNDHVTIEDIKNIMDTFSSLDIDADGALGQDDLHEWLRRAALKNPAPGTVKAYKRQWAQSLEVLIKHRVRPRGRRCSGQNFTSRRHR